MRSQGQVLLLVLMMAALGASPLRALGADDAAKAQAERICRHKENDLSKVLAPSFLARFSVEQIKPILEAYEKDLGACQRAEHVSGLDFTFVYPSGTVPAKVGLDAAGLVSTLWVGVAKRTGDSAAAIEAAFRSLPGEVSVLALGPKGDPLLRIEPTKPLAVGSTFKLFILRVLADEWDAKRRKPDDVVHLQKDRMSLPSGVLHSWPVGAPVTLHSLAAQMISISDNTATDHLLFLLGRENVEKVTTERNRPFLSTLEMFKLKSSANRSLADAWAKSPVAKKRATLGDIGKQPASVVDFGGSSAAPLHINDIEWFASTEELCATMAEVRALDVMHINPGITPTPEWETISYKGGSEPGVINMTLGLKKRGSAEWFCLSATWNDPKAPLDESRFVELVSRTASFLGK